MHAIIDIGSTSVRLALLDPTREVNPKKVLTTKLAEGMLSDGKLTEEAMARTVDAVAAFCREAESFGREPDIFATEAVRSAANKDRFLRLVHDATGRDVYVVSKEDEALLAFFGVYSSGRIGIVDMGGGSTELAVGDENGILYAKSLSDGVVRLFDRQKQGTDMTEYLAKRAKEYGDVPNFDNLYAVGGTACTIAAMLEGLAEYDASRVHGRTVTRDEARALYLKIKDMPLEERLKIKGLPQKRAEIIHNGLFFFTVILDYLGKDRFTVSERDNVEGYFAFLQNGKKWPQGVGKS